MANEADFYIKEGDTSPDIKFQLLEDDGTEIDLTNAIVNTKLKEVGGDSLAVDSRAVISSPTDGTARYEWSSGDTSSSGYYNTVFEVEYDAVTNVTGESHTYETGTDVYTLNNDRIIVSGYYDISIEDASGDTYEKEVDFEVVDDNNDSDLDSIDWSIGGSTPDDGEQFTVDYSYQTNSEFSVDETFPNSQYVVVRIDEGI